MINRDEVAREVETHLPIADQDIVKRIVANVCQDAEIIIRSMIRQAAAQERDKLYRRRSADKKANQLR